MGVIKRWDIDTVRVIGQKLLTDKGISLGPYFSFHPDVYTKLKKLLLHERRCQGRKNNGGGVAEGDGRSPASKTRVSSRGAIEVHSIRIGVLNGTCHEVSNAAGLERAAGLEIVQLEVDVAIRQN